MRKLIFLEEKLKIWKKEVFADIRVRKGELIREVEELDKVEDNRYPLDDELNRRVRQIEEFENILFKEEASCCEKARVTQVKEGDCNSKLFHKVATGKRRRGYIKDIEIDDGIIVGD